MLLDLIIGIVASLIASLISGFLGHKAISKQNNVILKVYVLFLSVSVFISGIMLSIILNKDFCERLAQISERNLLDFYNHAVTDLLIVVITIAFLTLIVILIEAIERGSQREHKEYMDRNKLYFKKDK